MVTTTVTIKRPTRLSTLNAFLVRLDYVQQLTQVQVHWVMSDSTNHLLWVDLEITLTVTGDQDSINVFTTLI